MSGFFYLNINGLPAIFYQLPNQHLRNLKLKRHFPFRIVISFICSSLNCEHQTQAHHELEVAFCFYSFLKSVFCGC
jgi:hypothetical protein